MKNKVAKARDVQPWQLHFVVFALTFRVATGFGIGQDGAGGVETGAASTTGCATGYTAHSFVVPCIINIDTLWNAAPRLILV